jgi:hypothetical protein
LGSSPALRRRALFNPSESEQVKDAWGWLCGVIVSIVGIGTLVFAPAKIQKAQQMAVRMVALKSFEERPISLPYATLTLAADRVRAGQKDHHPRI